MKVHSAAAGLAGGGGREASAPCALVEIEARSTRPPSPAQLPALGEEGGL